MLKKYASIIAAIAVIVPVVCIIAGIYFAVTAKSVWIFVYCAAPAALFYLFTQAYAKLLEATEDNRENIAKLIAALPKRESKAKPAAEKDKSSALPEGIVVCKSCGTAQRNDRTTCFNCGAKLE